MKIKKYAPLLAVVLMAGGVISMAGIANAQVVTPNTGTTTSTTGTYAKHHFSGLMGKLHAHKPLGNDGTITAVNGTTITMSEEANEGGAVYTVDASGATFVKNGVAATISDLKIGDKIFVDGAVTGSTVTATKVSLGHGQRVGHRTHTAKVVGVNK